MVGAGNIAGAAGAGAHAGRGLHHGADHLRVLAHAEIVVRAPDHDRTRPLRRMPGCVREPAGDALEIGEDAIAALLAQARQRIGKETIVRHAAEPPSARAGAKFYRRLRAFVDSLWV